MNAVLDRLRGGLIVSVQARAGSPLDDPAVLSAMARAAEENGAAGIRAQGVRNLQAIRKSIRVPVIGILKREYAGFEPYITATLEDVAGVLACGAEIVAFDATARTRPDGHPVSRTIDAIHAAGALAMADCSSTADGSAAQRAGADILATTLCGYTEETRGRFLPALDVVRELRLLDAFIICEGGIHSPAQAAQARSAGADAVVVGTAITNLEWLVSSFVAALR